MSVNYDDLEKQFDANIVGMFEDLAKQIHVGGEQIREIAVAQYRKDLQVLDDKARTLDNIVAIDKITQVTPDVRPEELWRKVRATLEGDGLL